MLNHFVGSVRALFTGGLPLELGLLLVVAVAVGFALRASWGQAPDPKVDGNALPSDVTPVPTARQWLARESVMNNDLPDPRETAPEPAPAPVASTGAAIVAAPPVAYENRPVDETIVFPTGRGFGDYRTVDLPPPRNGPADLTEPSAIASMLSEGLDDLGTGGDRLAQAVRERPVQYFVGALAAGFAAGLLFPMIYGRQRMAKLLERLIESNEELKHARLEERRARSKVD